MLAASQTSVQTETTPSMSYKKGKNKPSHDVICNTDNEPIRVINVRSARGIICSGDVMPESHNFNNILLITDDSDAFIHVIHRASIGLELNVPQIKRDKSGQKHIAGGFEQPLEAAVSRDPIMQARHTNPL